MALRFSRLDRPAIRRLKPDESITEHGITAERLADGDFRYSVGVMVDGKRIHRVVGRASDGVTRTQCEDFIEKVRTEAITPDEAFKLSQMVDTFVRAIETSDFDRRLQILENADAEKAANAVGWISR